MNRWIDLPGRLLFIPACIAFLAAAARAEPPEPLAAPPDPSRNFILSAGFEAWGGPVDDDDENNMGFVGALNFGFPILPDRRLGGQIGGSAAIYDLLGREDGTPRQEQKTESQYFVTAGLFIQPNLDGEFVSAADRIAVTVVQDMLFADRIGEGANSSVEVAQLRGRVGYWTDRATEIGAGFTMGLSGDALTNDGNAPVEALDRAGFFAKHHWPRGGITELGAGWADDPGEWYLDLHGDLPLDHQWAFYAGATYVFASTTAGDGANRFAEDLWSVGMGLRIYFDPFRPGPAGAGRGWLPQLPVANNGSFGLTVPQGGI